MTGRTARACGLALLHLDGKLDASAPDAVADRVRAAVNALLSASAPPPPAAERPNRSGS